MLLSEVKILVLLILLAIFLVGGICKTNKQNVFTKPGFRSASPLANSFYPAFCINRRCNDHYGNEKLELFNLFWEESKVFMLWFCINFFNYFFQFLWHDLIIHYPKHKPRKKNLNPAAIGPSLYDLWAWKYQICIMMLWVEWNPTHACMHVFHLHSRCSPWTAM